MKKTYIVPYIELISFVPAEPIASNPWEWDPRDQGKGMQNIWYANDKINIASVNSWIPFDGCELDGDPPIT